MLTKFSIRNLTTSFQNFTRKAINHRNEYQPLTSKFFCYKVPASEVKVLRNSTGAPLMECKKALQKFEGDMGKARQLLREKHFATAEKKEGNDALVGIYGVSFNEQKTSALLIKVASETDFVAKNDDFLDFCENILNVYNPSEHRRNFDLSKSENEENFNKQIASDRYCTQNTILEEQKLLTAKVGENCSLQLLKSFNCESDEIVGFYLHKCMRGDFLGKSGSQIIIKAQDSGEASNVQNLQGQLVRIADNLAVHVFGLKPKYLTRDTVEKEVMDAEMKKVMDSVGDSLEKKPKDIQEKIVEGKIMKFLSEDVLECQSLGFEDSDKNVKEYLEEIGKKLGKTISVREFFSF